MAACCPAQISKMKGGYLFRIKYKAGQITRYQTTTTTGNVGNSEKGMTIQIPLTLNVQSVSKGVAKVKVDIGRGMLNGKPFSGSDPHSMVIPLDSIDASQIGAQKFPLKPVPIGGSWEAMRPVQ